MQRVVSREEFPGLSSEDIPGIRLRYPELLMGDEPSNVIRLPGLNPSDTWDVKCHGSVKLRDEETGEYLRDEAGKVLTRPCLNWAVRWMMVCHAHGGTTKDPDNPKKLKAQRTKDELRDRLRELGDDAVRRVRDILDADAEGGPLAVVKTSDQLKAAEMVLSRFVPSKTESDVTTHKADHEDLDREIDEAIGDLALLKTEDDEDQEADTA